MTAGGPGGDDIAAFRQQLDKLGWHDPGNAHIEHRWAGGDPSRLPLLAAELARTNPEVTLVQGTGALAAMTQATRSPIVFIAVSDPVGQGFVASYPRPGGNITGFTLVDPAMAGKWLQLLKELAPETDRAAVLFDPEVSPSGGSAFLRALEDAGRPLGVASIAAPIHREAELASVVADFAREPRGGLVVLPDDFTVIHREEIVASAARHRLPALYPVRLFAAAGGVMSYGPDRQDQFRQGAGYVDRILRGAKPGDLPVEQPTKFELVINLKTAKALDLTVPQLLLAQADEVIE
ncbi:MAG TPA: ABC transporter substrate-binding protein [Stellaceae bacterium]|nr:ABC transporter substrate-binding protein [Stellaceae bacterium]